MSTAKQGAPAGNGAGARTEYDVVVIGAGFAGIYMLHRLRGMGLSARLYEAGDGAGGTWYWNRYPGAACDIESLEYSYSFSEELQQEWKWSTRFARQPEILAYINHVVDRFELRRDMQFNTRVTAAVFDEAAQRWRVSTDQGERISAQFCVMATGCLSAPKPIEYPGAQDFGGRIFHTAHWPKEPVDFSGQRVGVVGTGSSAIQCIPLIAEQAAHLHVFQRTPNFSVPAGNRPMDPDYERSVKARYAALRHKEFHSDAGIVAMLDPQTQSALQATPEERQREYETRWQAGGLYFYGSYVDLLVNREVNEELAEFARRKIRQKVRDPQVAELLCPKGYPFGAKRICADTGYFETFNRDNVSLVDIRKTPIRGLTRKGLQVGDTEYPLDCVIFATGFDAMTGALLNIDIRGRGGRTLRQKWAEGPRTYLGLMTEGFPNLFITTGPGSPSVLFNMVLGNEYHVNWITDCIAYLRSHGRGAIDATAGAEQDWCAHVNAVGEQTLFPQANSWYLGDNVPGKPRVILPYLGGFRAYSQKCEESAARDYEGFALS
ncbi:MAG: NAD(P)/FAD-dependent oxidoreductase [Nevskia sp.]|nr:NAD(P)/FAD-dependent oxidoreductase [Nevskia sp.]